MLPTIPGKVHDRKVEVLSALFRNMYLKEKRDYLDAECKMLAENVISCQVKSAEKNEKLISLQKKLEDLQQLCEQKTYELSLAQDKVASLSKVVENTLSSAQFSLNESISVNEELEYKNNMIECLQAELVHVRLDAAEKWALIRELTQEKDELEKDKEILTRTKPETIARLQEELIQAKLLENQYSNEFEIIRKQLVQLKNEMKKKNEKKSTDEKSDTKINLFKNAARWKKNNKDESKVEISEVLKEIAVLDREKAFLQSRVPELEKKIQILNKHSQFKESERFKMQEKLDDAKLRYQTLENLALERKRQCDFLENTASDQVHSVRNSCKEKEQNIDELSHKLHEINSERRKSYSTDIMRQESRTIQDLEDKIIFLENRIEKLKSDTNSLHPEIYSRETYEEHAGLR